METSLGIFIIILSISLPSYLHLVESQTYPPMIWYRMSTQFILIIPSVVISLIFPTIIVWKIYDLSLMISAVIMIPTAFIFSSSFSILISYIFGLIIPFFRKDFLAIWFLSIILSIIFFTVFLFIY